jgi:23S rRNA U2552 (ribose-2'-O)-methylase RlmE/FtsJ
MVGSLAHLPREQLQIIPRVRHARGALHVRAATVQIGRRSHRDRLDDLRGIDLKPLDTALPPNTVAIVGDALTPTPEVDAFLRENAPYDVVLSDMAPSTSGTAFQDQARSEELVQRTLDVADAWLNKGGAWVAKLFMSEALVELRKRVRSMFDEERVIRPEGTRSVSTEVFLIGIGKRTEPTALSPRASSAAPPPDERPAPSSAVPPASKSAEAARRPAPRTRKK